MNRSLIVLTQIVLSTMRFDETTLVLICSGERQDVSLSIPGGRERDGVET